MFLTTRALIARLAAVLLLSVYLSSMLLPAMCDRKLCTPGLGNFLSAMRGGVFYSGLDGTQETPFSVLIFFGWLANPIFLVGLWGLWRGKYQVAMHLGLIASMIGFCWWLGNLGFFSLPSEFDRWLEDKEICYGYWVWLCTFFLLTSTGFCLSVFRGRTNVTRRMPLFLGKS